MRHSFIKSSFCFYSFKWSLLLNNISLYILLLLSQTGQLNEYTERRELPADVLCMSLSEIPEGELRSRFLTVGLADKTVRIISLDPQDCLSPLR